ncbi:hypothetical protein [Pontibacterium sp.]
MLLLGSYTGYRAIELIRFSPFNSAGQEREK